jgi:TalC/MipB family fructose-6-phosphate aldolase
MKLWIAGTVPQVIAAARTGLPSAIVTNPTVVAEWTTDADKPIEEIAKQLLAETDLPLYIQLRGPDTDGFLREAEHFEQISSRILPKLPSTTDGIAAAAELEHQGRTTLVTTVCSVNQAYLCAAAGVSAICPYFARLDQSGDDAAAFLSRVAKLYRDHGAATKILPASIRSPAQAEAALCAGASGVIVFDDVFRAFCSHPVTASSLKAFEADWKQTLTQYPHDL